AQITVVDVEMLGGLAAHALQVLPELPRDRQRPYVAVVDVLGVVVEATEGVRRGQRDHDEGQDEEAKTDAEADGDRQAGEARHTTLIGTAQGKLMRAVS